MDKKYSFAHPMLQPEDEQHAQPSNDLTALMSQSMRQNSTANWSGW
jgi:hypothetical protein